VQRRPIGVLIVEQNIDLMQTVAARAYVMDKGRTVASLDRAAISDTETLSHHLAL
jgi:urea transport system ATP-binding protein